MTVFPTHYTVMLQDFFTPELGRRGIDLNTVRFQQGGAIADTARVSMAVVREMFLAHVIFGGGDVA